MSGYHLNPHLSDRYSDLQTLALQALRRYGDFRPGSVDGEVMLMFVEFANLVIDEVRQHPYWPADVELEYYKSATDVRPIPDPILLAGFLFHYAVQQLSDKAQAYQPAYARTMSQLLWNAKNGNTPLEMTVVDGGSRGGRS